MDTESSRLKELCKTKEEFWQCPNREYDEKCMSMTSERYFCTKCGQIDRLYYDEMS